MVDIGQIETKLRSFLDYFLQEERPAQEEADFLEYYKDIFLDITTYILYMWLFVTIVLWPSDFFLLSDRMIQGYIYWRSVTIALTAFGIVSLYIFEEFIKKYFTFCVVFFLGVVGGAYSGIIFGAFAEPGSPWFSICFILPVYSFFIPVSIINRVLFAHVFSFTYYGLFILPYQQHWNWPYHGITIILVSSVSTVLALAGHFYFGLIRRNYFQQQDLDEEREQSEELLLNILPENVSERLKNGEDVSERFDETTVLFADIVNFTPLAKEVPAEELVEKLDQIFSSFDRKLPEEGIEKIKTIGDEYFLVGGVPEYVDNHAVLCAETALNMMDMIDDFTRNGEDSFDLRIGMHTGPLVAGIIGEEKFVYDVWGDTVNIGSRMESQGEPGKIQVTQATKDAIQNQANGDGFTFEERGEIDVKGRGTIMSYFLGST